MKKIIKIEGMHCSHCSGRVEKTLSLLEGVKKVKVDLKKKYAEIVCDVDISNEVISNSITELGFEVIEIK